MNINTQDLYKMNKMNLIALVIKMQHNKGKVDTSKSIGRKEQVLQCLRSGVCTIDAIAEHLNINSKNVSCQLTYLRKDGHMIYSIRFNNVTTLKLEEL